jgi:hypothetical protein
MPATLGPTTIATYKNGFSTSDISLVPRNPLGPTTMRTAPQERVNARAKKLSTGWFLTKALMVVM